MPQMAPYMWNMILLLNLNMLIIILTSLYFESEF